MLINDLKRIENLVYLVEYDQLNDYLKGVRDIINLLNGEENPTEYIKSEVMEIVKKIYNM